MKIICFDAPGSALADLLFITYRNSLLSEYRPVQGPGLETAITFR